MLSVHEIKGSHRVVGYYACREDGRVFCDEEACIIAHSRHRMESYVLELSDDCPTKMDIKKITFGVMVESFIDGLSFAFDSRSYSKFREYAKRAKIKGIPLNPKASSAPVNFIKLKLLA